MQTDVFRIQSVVINFQIRSDAFKIGVDFWNLECHLEFRVHLWATVPGRTLCSPVRYFVINFI